MVLPQNIAAVLGGAWNLLNSTRSYLNGTLKPPTDGGYPAVGLLIYDPLGYMSANIASTNPAEFPSTNNDSTLTDADYANIGRYQLSYAGELHLWAGSNETVGTVTHGPLTMTNQPSWLTETQMRNYIVSKNNFQGRDVLHLWAANEKTDTVANLFWARAKAAC